MCGGCSHCKRNCGGTERKLANTRNFRLSSEKRAAFSRPGLEAFFKIAELWKLTKKEQVVLLGIKSYSFLSRLRDRRRRGILSVQMLERISYVLRIYRLLHQGILGNNDLVIDQWMKMPNAEPLFEKKPAMQFILDGDMPMERILVVVHYLEALYV